MDDIELPAPASNAEEAAQRQLYLFENKLGFSRYASLKPGFEVVEPGVFGTGTGVRNIETGEECQWNGKWFLNGKVLLCQDCWEEGT